MQTRNQLTSQKVRLNQITTNLQGTGYLKQNEFNQIVLEQGAAISPPDISIGNQDEVLTTNNGVTDWQKLSENSILNGTLSYSKTSFADQNLLTTSSPAFTKVTVTNAPTENSDLANKLYVDQNVGQVADNSVSTQKIQDSAVTSDKIANNNVSLQKLVHPTQANQILLSKGNTNPDWGLLENQNITENTINQSKIISLPFTKLTGTIDLTQIQDTYIPKSKQTWPKNPKQLFVDFVLGSDSYEGSEQKPYKYLQTAINAAEQATIITIKSNITENVVIDTKNQLALVYYSSKIQNSPNLTHTGQIWIKNSQSIKFQGIQLDYSSTPAHPLIIENTTSFFCKESTIVGQASYGVFIDGCVYSQFQNCELSLYPRQVQPAALNTILIYQNSQINNSISNTVQNYLVAVDQSIIVGALNFSASSLLIYNSQIYQNLIYSAASPNILALVNNRFYDQNFSIKTLSKSGTSSMVYQNNILNQSSSVFGNTRIYQQLVLNSDIQDSAVSNSKISDIAYSKISNSTANRYLKFNGSGVISLQDLSAETIGNNQITSLDVSKLFQPLPYSDLPLRSKNDGTLGFAQLKDSDLATNTISISKIKGNAGTAGQLLTTDGTNVYWNNPSSQISFPNDPNLFLMGNNTFVKVDTLDKFDSANTIASQYVSGSQCIFWGQNNVDASTAQIRYFNIPNAINDFSPARCINIGKINFGNDNRYSVPVQVTSSSFGSLQPGHFPGWSFSKALCNIWNGGGSASTPLDQYLHTNASTGDLEWVSAPTVTIADNSITNAKLVDLTIQAGKIGDLQISTAKIQDNAITTAKINDNQITASKLTANSVSNLKIIDNAVDLNKLAFVSGIKTDNRVVCIRAGNLQTLDASINPGVLLSSLGTYNPGFGTSHAVANQINYPFFQSSIPNSTYNITPQISTLFQSANGVFSMNQKTNSQFSPACGWSVQENGSGINYTIGFSGILTGGTGSLTSSNGLICSNFSSNIACIFKSLGNDNTNISGGTNAASPTVYLNQNGTLSIPSSQALKQTITKLNRQKDEDFAKAFVQNVDLYSYTYNTSNAEVLRHAKKECQCQNETQCKDLLYSAYEKAVQRNVGFLAEEVLPYQTIQLQRTQKNVCSKTKQLLIDQGMPQILAEEMHQKALETEAKYEEQISRQDVSTILFLEVKRLQKENEALKTRLDRICQILNINA